MLSTETVRLQLPRLIPFSRDRNAAGDCVLNMVKPHKREYQKRKAAGLCTSTGCREEPAVGHLHCRRHLQHMSERNKEQYQRRMRADVCIYCGVRPQFWGVRRAICRQRFTKHPLPSGARRALRLYREAENKREREQVEVDARHAVGKLLAIEVDFSLTAERVVRELERIAAVRRLSPQAENRQWSGVHRAGPG
jgi:hypothetical protein